MPSKTSLAIALVLADKSTLSLRQKCKLAAHKVGLLSTDGLLLAYRHLQDTAEHRCPVCHNMNARG